MNQEKIENERSFPHRERNHGGRVVAGLIIVAVGAGLLARKMGVDIPGWLFTWQVLLIVLGFFFGAKSGFRGFGWTIPVLIGLVMLVDEMMPGMYLQRYLWPVLLIVAGLFMIFRPRSHCKGPWTRYKENRGEQSMENTIDTTAIFGGVEKTIASKDFRGGEVNCVFGGAEIDLSQADIKGTVVLEANQIFGGTKLIIPPHWQLQSEVTAILGGIEDKRVVLKEGTDPDKVLILKGTCILGGMEIKSY